MLNKTKAITVYKLAAAKLAVALSVSLLSGQAVWAQSSLASVVGDADNGGALLEARCTACHVQMFGDDGNNVYTRPDRKVNTIEGLMRRVEQCNAATQNGELSADQVNDITAYLNKAVYKFDDS